MWIKLMPKHSNQSNQAKIFVDRGDDYVLSFVMVALARDSVAYPGSDQTILGIAKGKR